MAMEEASVGDDVDRISALPDDLLHLILGFVRCGEAVTRTAALSRRWRRVWIYAQHLVLSDAAAGASARATAEPGQFVGFVDWALAQRGDADIESLDIRMSLRSSLDEAHTSQSQEKVNEWLRYATQQVVKSFRLVLGAAGTADEDDFHPVPAVVLPDRGRMTSIAMFLESCYSLRLPAAASSARYEALTELKLCSASFSGEGSSSAAGRTLGDFVSSSSCCPRLRTLELFYLSGLARLAIRSEALETLRIICTEGDLRVLDVTAPNLRVLQLDDCFGDGMGDDDEENKKARIASSSLQKVGIRLPWWCHRPDMEIRGLKSVRWISNNLRVTMHGQHYVGSKDVGFWLLQQCPSVEHVSLLLRHDPSQGDNVIQGDDIMVDLTSSEEGMAAPFAMVRSMDITVRAHEFQDYQLVLSIFALLLRCPGLRSLSIRNTDVDTTWAMPLCWKCAYCDEQYAWTHNRAISLESLEDVKLIGFGGADEDIDLVRLLFASSKDSIKSMTLDKITKTPGTVSLKRLMAEDGNGTETIDQKLMNIPTVDRGRWHFGSTIHTWTRYATENTYK